MIRWKLLQPPISLSSLHFLHSFSLIFLLDNQAALIKQQVLSYQICIWNFKHLTARKQFYLLLYHYHLFDEDSKILEILVWICRKWSTRQYKIWRGKGEKKTKTIKARNLFQYKSLNGSLSQIFYMLEPEALA